METILFSRLQFAFSAMFHFLFVPLTIGLGTIIAYMETKYVKTNNIIYLKMSKFWGKFFLINFSIGVVTGIALQFQFGTNWANFSTHIGNIFGPLLAIEATTSFFLESILIGVWAFGWNKISPKAHATIAWLIAIASITSAVWILIANGWMQHPVGVIIDNNKIKLNNLIEIITNKFALLEILHVIPACFLLSSFFVMSISSWHLLKKQHIEFFKKSFKIALVLGLFSSISVVIIGDFHGNNIAKTQPVKLAAMEAIWETQTQAPILLFTIPNAEKEENKFTIGKIPGVLSLLAHRNINAEVKGLKDFPKNERPPVLPIFIGFRIMVILGMFFILLTITGLFIQKNIIKRKIYLKIILFSLPLPYIATQMGWIVTEVGRQPWIIYGLFKTSNASSNIPKNYTFFSLISFIIIYGFIAAIGFYFMVSSAKKGPTLD